MLPVKIVPSSPASKAATRRLQKQVEFLPNIRERKPFAAIEFVNTNLNFDAKLFKTSLIVSIVHA